MIIRLARNLRRAETLCGTNNQISMEPVGRLLFQAASETITTIAADPEHLGARIGITAVLHTWGSAMTHHPHIHMIVPGGGLSPGGSRWVSSRPAFLLPVRVLGKLFRRLFLTRLMALYDAGRLGFFGTIAHLAERRAFLRQLAPVLKKRWVVYAKPPFAGPETVLAYLSRYTHRVAISNSRLLRFDEAGVTLSYKDYRRSGADRQRVMTLPPTSSSAASCFTSYQRASTASVTMACSPVPPARPVSTTSAGCSGSRRSPTPMRRSTRRMSARHAHAVAATWSSSRPSSAPAGHEVRRTASPWPGPSRHDPA